MKLFLCQKRLTVTTLSWCMRHSQNQEGGKCDCSSCPVFNERAMPRLYSIDELCGDDMMEEYKQMAGLQEKSPRDCALAA